MPKNHRNRNWRLHWTCEPLSRTAVHKSGLKVKVIISQRDASKNQLTLEGCDQIDAERWDFMTIYDQALKLWKEGKI